VRTRAYTNTYTHTHTGTHTHMRTHIRTHTHAHTRTHTGNQGMRALRGKRIERHTTKHTHTLVYAHNYTNTHAHTRTVMMCRRKVDMKEGSKQLFFTGPSKIGNTSHFAMNLSAVEQNILQRTATRCKRYTYYHSESCQ